MASQVTQMARQMSPTTKGITYLWLIITTICVFFPVVYALLGAFHPTVELNQSIGRIFTGTWTLENFKNAWEESDIGPQLMNSFIVTIVQTVGKFVTAILAAFALVYGRFRSWAPAVFLVCVIPMVFPGETNNLVNFLTVSRMGFYDNIVGIFLPHLTSAVDLFLFYQAFRTFPKEIHEAATMEGVGPLRFLVTFLIPLNRAVCFTVIINSAIGAWNSYMWPLLITTSEEVRTIQPGIRSLASENSQDTGMVLAGLFIASIPMLLLLVAGQRYITRGLTVGAVK